MTQPEIEEIPYVYRVLYRGNGRENWWLHTAGKGTKFYINIGAAKAAITQFKKQNRWYRHGDYEYKIQRVPASAWEDVPE